MVCGRGSDVQSVERVVVSMEQHSSSCRDFGSCEMEWKGHRSKQHGSLFRPDGRQRTSAKFWRNGSTSEPYGNFFFLVQKMPCEISGDFVSTPVEVQFGAWNENLAVSECQIVTKTGSGR